MKKLISRGGGASLNLFRYAAMVLVLLTLGIGNAWAGHGGPHYAQVKAVSTGNGKVYLTATNNYSVKDSEWKTTEMSTSWNCGENNDTDTKTYYFHAKANDGYVFAGWSTSESTNTKTSTSTSAGISTTADGGSPSKANTYYAHFWQPMVGTAVCPDDINVSLKGQSGTATVTFNVSRAVAVSNFTGTPTLGSGFTIQSGPTISSLDGNGAGTVSYVLQYTAGATHGESSATIELNSNYNSTSAFCTVNANFPNITISGSDPEVPVFDVMPTEVVEGTAEFDVAYAATDGSEFVQWPLVPVVTSGYSGWTITSCTFADGKVTVNYSFDPNGNYGNHSATLTLAATAAAGGASKTLNLGVVINEPSDKAAVVTLGGYEKEWDTFAEALADANSHEGCTLKLLNNCEVNASQAFTKSMTLDLNGFELKRAGITAAGEALLLDTSGKTLYVTDTKPGAKGSIVAVASSSVAVTGIRVGNGCKLLMDKGSINVTTPGATARGVYSTTTPTSENMVVVSDVTINTTAASQSIGIDCASSSATDSGDPEVANVILSNVTINAETSGTTEAYAIRTAKGVALLVNSGTYTATAKTTTAYTLSTSGYTAIVNGTFNATAVGKIARAIHVVAGITAVKNGTFTATATTEQAHATYVETGAKLLVYGGTFRGECTEVVAGAWATGTLVKGALEAQGGTFIGEISKPGLSASAPQKSYAAGMYVYSGSSVSLANTTLRGEMKSTYLTNGGSSEWAGGAYGVYSATTNPLAITNSTLTAISAYQGGFGIRLNNTPVEIKNSTLSVNTTYAYNYGIFTQGTADVKVENSTITAVSGTTYAYGAYVYGGTLLALNSTFNATTQRTGATSAGDCNLFGINVYTGKTATLNGCTINATGSGQYSNNGYGVYVNGTADIEDCNVTVSNINSGAYAIGNTANTTRIGVASGKFKATATSTGIASNGTAAAGKQTLYGGYYNTNTNLAKYLPTSYSIETLPTSAAEYADGYRYAIRPGSNLSPVCKIGATPYYSLEEALEYANKNSGTTMTILMVANYTLPAGNYTLPSNATLLVPMSGQTTLKEHPDRKYSYTSPTANCILTFADGVKMDVWGKIETGGNQSGINQLPGNNGMVTDSYGRLHLKGCSSIILESGSKLYAWGYVTGEFDAEGKYSCEIDAKRGSTVYEFIQIKDWRGGTCTKKMYQTPNQAFPFNQFYVQNIECPVKFRPGSKEICDLCVNAMSSTQPYNGVNFIGVNNTSSFFEMDDNDMSEDTWVRKWYNAKIDQQVYDVNSNASMNSIILTLYGYSFNSAKYILPVPNNMKIHLLTGRMQLTQNTELLPGAEIEIDKEATAYIASGKSLYVFDIDEWNAFNTDIHTYPVPYSPSWAGGGKTCPRAQKISTDASVNVHGSLVVNGKLYTTAGGANIYSSNADAGTIRYGTAAPSNSTTINVANNTGPTYTSQTANPAWLKNGDGTYAYTAGTIAGKSWIYYDGKWNCWEERDCFGYDNADHPYAKPRAWVQLTSNVADANHLYHDAETGARAFLVEDGCTWWEVEPTPYDGNKYKCVDADYDGRHKYYEYVDGKWQEAVVTITWKNGSTTLATYSNALYGVSPKYLSASPSKTATASEYYTWLGWTVGSAKGEFYDKDAELPVVTENTTFYAYFETHKYSYAVLFKNYDGSVLQGTSWEHGQVPYYSGEEPKKPATAAKEYAFIGWSPASFSAVTGGGSVYTAQFAESDRKYTVQWVNYDGTVLKEEQVTYGTTPSAPVTPTRPNDTYYTYTFDAWSPAISAVTGNQTYTATYNYEKKVTKYSVTFTNGSTTIYTQNLVANSVPVFDGTLPTKAADAQYTYTFDGWSTSNGGALVYAAGAALPALTADVTYYAHFATSTNNYRIIWKSENGKVTLETDPTVPYGTTPSFDGATPTKDRVGKTGYEFDGWSASIGGEKLASLPKVTKDNVFYAHFLEGTYYNITFNANGHGSAPAGYEAIGGSKLSAPEAPTETGYTFGGWYKESTCTNAWNFASDVVTAAQTLYAKWTINQYTLTVLSANETMGTVTGGGKYDYNTSHTITATPKTGYKFVEWDDHNTNASREVTVTEDVTYTATFDYDIANYTVKHWQQNIDNDEYTEVVADRQTNLSGTIGTLTNAVAKSYTGFDALPFDQETIAVSGTEVNIRYNRKTYLIKWDVKLNGEREAYKEETLRYGATPSYGDNPTKKPSTCCVYSFSGWQQPIVTVTADATYTGSFDVSPRPYTITFLNDDGTELWHYDFGYGSTPSYGGSTPESSHKGDGYTYTHEGWKPALAPVNGTATYTAKYDRSAEAITVSTQETVTDNTVASTTTVENHGELTIEEAELHSTTIVVESGGQLDIKEGASVEADVFIIEATTEEQGTNPEALEEVQVSGELSETGSKNLKAIYYDLTRKGGTEPFLARVWYAVAVPWAVETPNYSNGGVFIKRGEEFIPQRLGATFDLISYDGECRAKNGASANCWVYLEDEIDGGAAEVMVPGKLYMIYLTEETSTIRFKKADDDSPIHTNSLTVSAHNETSNANDANWNGIANPATYRAYMNVNVGEGGLVQKFVPGTQPRDGGSYLPLDLRDKQAVGQPFFVQVHPSVGTEASVVVTRTNSSSAPAPRRAQVSEDKEARYAIGIAANGKLTDRLYIQTAEEKEDKYVIGKDMSKMGVSSYVAQMWIERFNSKLCLNTMALTNNTASYPLGIYAPQAGEYMIFAPTDIADGSNIFLTLDGRVIWNLTIAPYYASLEKGTDTRYGLRIVRTKTPAITTGVEGVQSENAQCTKVIMDDHVYILRGEELYTITGQKAK